MSDLTSRRPLQRVRCLLVLVLCLTPFGAALANDLHRVMELSGLVEQVEMIPAQVNEAMTQQLAAMPPDVVSGSVTESLERAVTEALSAERMLEGMARRLDGEADAEVLADMIVWYESDLGRRVTAAEVQGFSAQASERIMASVDSLLADQERAALARSINELVDGTTASLALMEATQVAMLSVLEQSGALVGADGDTVRDGIRHAVEQARPEVERHMVATYVYMYRELSAAEIGRYRDFLARPDVRRFGLATQEAFLQEWRAAFEIMARNLVDALETVRAGLDSA